MVFQNGKILDLPFVILKRQTLVLWISCLFLFSCNSENESQPGEVGYTEITKWQDGKKAAASITYDDGIITQFHTALPIMDELGLPGTFYVPTGKIPGSQYKPQFIGRPVKEIIEETAEEATNEENFFERASVVRFSGYNDTYSYHTEAGQLFESGRTDEAYILIDEVYEKIRNNEFEPKETDVIDPKDYNVLDEDAEQITWEELREYGDNGHEIGSHTIAHPRLAVLDEENMLYELEKSREDILNNLGEEHTFSAEGPYGTEDERVMEYALEIYPALRNRMPEPFLEELNRSSDADPGEFDTEYVQWQRGALSDTPMDTMKEWIDTSISHDNIWLVLVFHGVDDVGWEPLTAEELQEYFEYMDEHEQYLWVATFKDVTKYMRERMAAEINTEATENQIEIELTHTLDEALYDHPLTLKTYVPTQWDAAMVEQGDIKEEVTIHEDNGGSYVLYSGTPNNGTIRLTSDN